MMSNKPQRTEIKDTSLLEAFFHDNNMAQTLDLPLEESLRTFLDIIYIDVLNGYEAQRTAEDVLRIMEGKAASHAFDNNVFNYDLISQLEDSLAEVIRKTIALTKS